jgi:hypothetical protein
LTSRDRALDDLKGKADLRGSPPGKRARRRHRATKLVEHVLEPDACGVPAERQLGIGRGEDEPPPAGPRQLLRDSFDVRPRVHSLAPR